MIEQVQHVARTTIVQDAWQRGAAAHAARLDLRHLRRPREGPAHRGGLAGQARSRTTWPRSPTSRATSATLDPSRQRHEDVRGTAPAHRVSRRHARRRAGRARRDPRRVGRRQVDAAQPHRRPRSRPMRGTIVVAGQDLAPLDDDALHAAAAQAHRLRVPGVPRAALPDGRAERRAAARAPRARRARSASDRVAADARGGRARRSRREHAARALRRRAAARRHRARARPPSGDRARRRADRQSRSGVGRGRDRAPARPRARAESACGVLVTHSRAAAAVADRVLTLTATGLVEGS